MRLHFISLLFFISLPLFAQKIPYIPLYILDTNTIEGQQFTFDKTAESENFILIWGNTVGTDPANFPDQDLAFNPQVILDTLEFLYTGFKAFGFADESAGTNLSQYKIPIVMYGTWGPDGASGYANGGSVDGVIGAFWVHPIAMHGGHVAAHELSHALQAQTIIDYRAAHGLGGVWDNSGIFWETHANFMRNLFYPNDVTAWGMDVFHIESWGDWKNTYENYALLNALMEEANLETINRLWRESFSNEYPLQAYKRLGNYTQAEFNDLLYRYASRMATYDFLFKGIGIYFRQYRNNDLKYFLPAAQATYTILKQDTLSPDHFSIPIELAPEEFAYNVIPLYPAEDSCAVIIKFKGHLEANPHAGWRYGFVTAFPDGNVSRYSETYDLDSLEIALQLLPSEVNLYLVVMGAPKDEITTNTSNDTWKGYPKHFRYPYELSIHGAVPEGFQPADDFRAQLKNAGHHHENGGGWIEHSATVSSSAYVAPTAIVLGNAIINGNVRIENTAIVKDANLSGNAVIRDNALVVGGTLSGNAIVAGQAFAENDQITDNAIVHMRARVSNYKLSGNIEVGGDVLVYNQDGDCDNGVYYRMTNYYEDNLLECDGRTATHPANLDVNQVITSFTASQLEPECTCSTFPNCLMAGLSADAGLENQFKLFPNPAFSTLFIQATFDQIQSYSIQMYSLEGKLVRSQSATGSSLLELDVTSLPAGLYLVSVLQEGKQPQNSRVVLTR